MSKAKKSAKKDKELLKKHFGDLKKHSGDLSILIGKARNLSGKDQNHFCENTVKEYTPRIASVLASIEQVYPAAKDIEYAEYLRDNFQFSEEEEIDIDVFSDIVTSLEGFIGTIESKLKFEK